MYDRKNGSDDMMQIRRQMQQSDEAKIKRKKEQAAQKKSSTENISVSEPEDASEKEADTIAKKVVSGQGAEIPTANSSSTVQLKSDGENSGVSSELKSPLSSSKGSDQSEIKRQPDNSEEYIIQTGESPYSIAQKLHVNLNRLLSLNGYKLETINIKGEDKQKVIDIKTGKEHIFHTGEVLKIPAKSPSFKTGAVITNSNVNYTREQQFEIALALSDYHYEQVEGFEEFRPGGFRYNPAKAYNELISIRKTTANNSLKLSDLEGMANYNQGYYFDLNTEAGRVMYNNKMKAKGDPYAPTQELVNRQIAEQKGDDQIRKDVTNGVKFISIVIAKLDVKIKDIKTPQVKRVQLLQKKIRLQQSQQTILKILKDEYDEEHKNDKKKDSKVQEANLALPIIEAVIYIIGVLILITAFVILLSQALLELGKVLDDTQVDDDVDLDDIDISDVLPKGVVLPKDGSDPKNNPKTDPKPNPPLPGVPVKEKDKDKDDDCKPVPLGYHKGDINDVLSSRYQMTKRSNEIADIEPPNIPDQDGKLGDWKLKGITFDGFGPNTTYSKKGELWEVKAHNYEYYTDEYKGYAIQSIKNSVQLKANQRAIAEGCGFHYVLALVSEEEKIRVEQEYPGLDIRVFPKK
jgi:hypothetical protein